MSCYYVHESPMTNEKHLSSRLLVKCWWEEEVWFEWQGDRITSSWPCWIRSGPVRNSISSTIVFKPSFWAPVSSPCCRSGISCLLMNWESFLVAEFKALHQQILAPVRSVSMFYTRLTPPGDRIYSTRTSATLVDQCTIFSAAAVWESEKCHRRSNKWLTVRDGY